MDLRPLTEDDWRALWPLLRGMGTHGGEQEARARFERLVGDPRWFVVGAEAGGILVGYAAAQDLGPHLRTGNAHRTARLHDLWVEPASRRRGGGRALLDAVLGWARARVRYVEWQAHETRSAPFYEHLGYRGEPCPQPDYPTFEVDFGVRDP